MKRISYLVATNLLVLLALSLSASLLGLDRYLSSHHLDWRVLLFVLLGFGLCGALLSLRVVNQSVHWALKLLPAATLDYRRGAQVSLSVQKHAKNAGIPMPAVMVYAGAPNALVTGTGPEDAQLALSYSLIEKLSPEELDAVIAHEVAHIANGDMVTMTLMQGVLNTFVLFFCRLASYALDGGLRPGRDPDLRPGWAYATTHTALMALAGWAAAFWVAGWSRGREFRADAQAIQWLGRRDTLIQALNRLTQLEQTPLPRSLAVLAFMGSKPMWFSTHPSPAQRIERLQKTIV